MAPTGISKTIIIIAVSKYSGALSNLPGTLESAKAMRNWAKAATPERQYEVVWITDEDGEAVTVDRVKTEINGYLDTHFVDRLVVYFAGHGMVKSTGDQYWLLTRADEDAMEGIDVEAFRRGLQKCGIGRDFSAGGGQLCLISDACRNVDVRTLDFSGHPIITRTSRSEPIQLDRFFSTSLGDYSYEVQDPEAGNAYCLFSRIMTEALEGRVPQAIETQNHAEKPAVISTSLAPYLYDEVKRRAAELEVNMEPDILPGFWPPDNVYTKIGATDPVLNQPAGTPGEPDLPGPAPMGGPTAPPDPPGTLKKSQASTDALLRDGPQTIRQIFSAPLSDWTLGSMSPAHHRRGTSPLAMLFPQEKRLDQSTLLSANRSGSKLQTVAAVCNFQPTDIRVPQQTEVTVLQLGAQHVILTSELGGNPIAVRNGPHWTLVPSYPRVVSVLYKEMPGDVLLNVQYRDEFDTLLSDFAVMNGRAPLKVADVEHYADEIRMEKYQFPHQSVVAGYLYEYAGDYGNIARTAHYMARHFYPGLVPFDLALLCADHITWSREDGRLVASADLPEVKESRDPRNDRPGYTRRGFKKAPNTKLWGTMPIFRQGWQFLKSESHLEVRDGIRAIADHIRGRACANLDDEGMEQFMQVFGYGNHLAAAEPAHSGAGMLLQED